MSTGKNESKAFERINYASNRVSASLKITNKVSVTIQISEDLKNEAEAVFAQSGNTFSSAVETLLQQGLADKTIALHLARGREAVKIALQAVKEQAVIDGTTEMSMYEIDAEISDSRRENRE